MIALANTYLCPEGSFFSESINCLSNIPNPELELELPARYSKQLIQILSADLKCFQYRDLF